MNYRKASARPLVGKLLSHVTRLQATMTPTTPSSSALVLSTLKLRPFSQLSFTETTDTLST